METPPFRTWTVRSTLTVPESFYRGSLKDLDVRIYSLPSDPPSLTGTLQSLFRRRLIGTWWSPRGSNPPTVSPVSVSLSSLQFICLFSPESSVRIPTSIGPFSEFIPYRNLDGN